MTIRPRSFPRRRVASRLAAGLALAATISAQALAQSAPPTAATAPPPASTTPSRPGEPSFYERVGARLAANPELAAKLDRPAPELQSVAWMAGSWDVTATVFATATTPERSEKGVSSVSRVLAGTWLQIVDSYAQGGTQDLGFLTFDQVRSVWVALALDSTGTTIATTSRGWEGNRLPLTGDVEILGERVTLRQTIEKRSDDEYSVLNEERLADGSWRRLDGYEYRRRR